MKLIFTWIAFGAFSCFTLAAGARVIAPGNPFSALKKTVTKRFQRSRSTPAAGRPAPATDSSATDDSSDQQNEARVPLKHHRGDGSVCDAYVDFIRRAGIDSACWASSDKYKLDICTFYATDGHYVPECFDLPVPDRNYKTIMCFHKNAPMLADNVDFRHKYVCWLLLADTCDKFLTVGRWDDGCFANYEKFRAHICSKIPTADKCNQAGQEKPPTPEEFGSSAKSSDGDSDTTRQNFKRSARAYSGVESKFAREDFRSQGGVSNDRSSGGGNQQNGETFDGSRRDFAGADSKFTREDFRPEYFRKRSPREYSGAHGNYAREDVRPPSNADGQSYHTEYHTRRNPSEYSGVHGSYAREDFRPSAKKRSNSFAGERQKPKESYPAYPGVNTQYAREEFSRPPPPSAEGTSGERHKPRESHPSYPGTNTQYAREEFSRPPPPSAGGTSREWYKPRESYPYYPGTNTQYAREEFSRPKPPSAGGTSGEPGRPASDEEDQRRRGSSAESHQPPKGTNSDSNDASRNRDSPQGNAARRNKVNPEAEPFSESFVSNWLTMGQYVRRGVCIERDPICGAKDSMRKTYRQAILAVHPDRNGCKNERDVRNQHDAENSKEYCDRLVSRFAQVQTSWESWSNMLVACAC